MSYVSEKQIKQIAQKISNDYAQKNGSYDEFIAGSTKQILSTVKINDQVPYTFRTAGDSADIGDRLDDTIVGGTIVWNQLVQNGDFSYGKDNWFTTSATCTVSDGIATVISSSGAGGLVQNISVTTGHKYLVCTNVSLGDVGFIASVRFNQQDINIPRQEGWQPIRSIIIGDETKNNSIYFMIPNTGNTIYVEKTNVFDLTLMFGTTIANYIYSLEQSTAGAGVAWFKNYFPKDYYAYNAKEMLSVNVSSHDMVGFNAYDNASGKAKLVGGMEYQITGTYTSLSYSSGETIATDSDGYFTPSVSGELSVVGGNDSDTCVHLVWDGEKDGEFEEYIKHSYPLDSSLTLRGVPMLDVNNKLYYDGDIYESDGTVTRRAIKVTLDGSESWVIGQSTYTEHQYFRTIVGDYGSVIAGRCISDKLQQSNIALSNTNTGITITNSTGQNKAIIIIRPENITDFTSLAEFKTWLAANPVTVIYLLSDAYATIETADPFINPQIVDDFGTEEYTNPRSNPEAFSTEKTYNVGNFVSYDDHCYRCITAVTEAGEWDSTKWELDDLIVEVPVGHNTDYYPNLRAKLEMSPDSPDGDGDYIVRQSGGENTYVPLTKELPAAPSEDGNYVLKVTVANGTPTYSWEAQA